MITADKLFLQLAEKAGIPSTDQKLIDLLGNTELNRINVADELVNGFESKLLSIDDAKANHPQIKTHYFAEVMSNVDRALDKIYEDFEFTEEEKTDVGKERSSTKRIALVAAKLKERGEAAVAAAGTGKNANTQALNNTINELNGQLAALKTEKKNLEKTHTEQLNSLKLETAMNGKLSGIKTVLDTLPGDVRNASVRNLINKELQDNDILLIQDEQGNLKLQKKDGSNYFDENNRQPTVDEFFQRSLAKHKVLPQSPAPPKPGETNGQVTTEIITGKTKNGGYDMKSLIDESLSSLENENPLSVMQGSK